jgi:acyl transferase domain-containing protein
VNDIAIVGLGCRFPRAPHVGAYWRNICDARVCFSEIPAERWNHALFYDPSPRAIDKTYARKVGLLDDVRAFSAMHYGLAPLRVSVMDPQHRLLLDTVRVALEDAGYGEAMLAGSRTGVFVGASVSEYKDLITSRLRARAMFDGQWGRAPAAAPEVVDALVEDVTPLRAFTIAGNLLNMAAATVAQTFDLRGPAFTIDAACSSSLVAAFDAVLSLRARVCDIAIAGGVYLNLTPDNLVGFSRIGAISPSDACRPFDAKSDGFVLGEGVGAVLLKRLDDALRDRDRIYAVIRGAGINNDGRGEGPMTPRLEGQLDAIERAHAEVDFTPDAIGFIEAHGTATAVGDATEIGALRRYFDEHTKGPIDCVVSSVKANIGHTMSAAGVAGLIKAALVLERAHLPPQAAFARPHDAIGLTGSGFRVVADAATFRANGPRRAAVSSFGFGGTNCHLVLEQAPATRRAVVAVPETPRPEPFVVSAPEPELLAAHLAELHEAISDDVPLVDIAHALATRARFDARVGFVARTHAELRARLVAASEAVRTGTPTPGVWFAAKPLPADEQRIAMLFPGQGAQTLGLCKTLYDRFPRFRARLDSLAGDLDGLLARPLLAYIYPPRNGAPFDEAAAMRALTATEVCQPAMAALGLAMFDFVEQLGVQASVFAGHSLGEFVALAAGGAMSPRDALRFVARRGRIMADVPLVDRGAMSAVQGERTFVERHLGGSDEVVVANVNHPKQTMISGATDAVLAAGARLAAAGATVTRLSVSHAFHSPLLAITDAPLGELVATLDVQPATRPVISCIEPGPYPQDRDAVRAVMAAHATSAVDFVGGVRALAETGATIFVQAAAGTTLLAMARATLRADGRSPAATIALGGATDDDGTPFLEALVELAVLGVPVGLQHVHDGEDRSIAWLPPTPLPTEQYWCANKTDKPREPLPAVGAGAPPSDDVVALFRQQMDVLKAHAEIMRRQAEVLAGAKPSSAESVPRATELPAPVKPPEGAAVKPLPAVAPTTTVPLAVESQPPVTPERDDVEAAMLDLVAQVSAFPRTGLALSQRLVADLGFDSLMIVELAGKASDAFPGLKGLPKALFAGETTIADVIAHVRGVKRARVEPPVDTHLALARYVPTLADRPLASLPADAIAPFTGPIAVLADRRGVAGELATRLRGIGVDMCVLDDAHALSEATATRGVIDLRALDATALDLAPAKLRASVDSALAIAKTLAPRRPSLFTIAFARVHDAALCGFAKALAREWPDARVKSIVVDPSRSPDATAGALFAELVGSDAPTRGQRHLGRRDHRRRTRPRREDRPRAGPPPSREARVARAVGARRQRGSARRRDHHRRWSGDLRALRRPRRRGRVDRSRGRPPAVRTDRGRDPRRRRHRGCFCRGQGPETVRCRVRHQGRWLARARACDAQRSRAGRTRIDLVVGPVRERPADRLRRGEPSRRDARGGVEPHSTRDACGGARSAALGWECDGVDDPRRRARGDAGTWRALPRRYDRPRGGARGARSGRGSGRDPARPRRRARTRGPRARAGWPRHAPVPRGSPDRRRARATARGRRRLPRRRRRSRARRADHVERARAARRRAVARRTHRARHPRARWRWRRDRCRARTCGRQARIPRARRAVFWRRRRARSVRARAAAAVARRVLRASYVSRSAASRRDLGRRRRCEPHRRHRARRAHRRARRPADRVRGRSARRRRELPAGGVLHARAPPSRRPAARLRRAPCARADRARSARGVPRATRSAAG